MFKKTLLSIFVILSISIISCNTDDIKDVEIELNDPGDINGDGGGDGGGDGNTDPDFGYAFFFTQIERPCQGAPIVPVGWIRIRVQDSSTNQTDVA